MFRGFYSLLIITGLLLTSLSLNAGFKIPPLSKSKFREPFQCISQDALIVFDKNNEKLIMEFKYKGDVENFAWVIPFPAKPSVFKVDISPFEELKNLYSKSLLHTPMLDAMELNSVKKMINLALTKKKNKEIIADDVQVINRKQVGVYDTVVLSTSDITSLKKWLKNNGFAVNTDSEKIIKHYSGKKYYWLALKVGFKPNKATHATFKNSGTLPPVAVEFKTDKPYYPLYSFAGKKNKLHLNLFLFAKKIYSNDIFISTPSTILTVQELARKLYDYTYINSVYDSKTDKECLTECRKILPALSSFMFFKIKNILPSVYAVTPEIASASWFCMKYKLNINKKNIKNDIIFSDSKKIVELTVKNLIDSELQAKYKFSKDSVATAFVYPKPLGNSLNSEKKRLNFLMKNNSDGLAWTKTKKISASLFKALQKQNLLKAFLIYQCKDINDKLNLLDAFIDFTGKIPDINMYPLFRSAIANMVMQPETNTVEELLPEISVTYSFKTSFKSQRFNSKFYKIPASLNSSEAKRQYYALVMLYFYRDPIAGKVLLQWLGHNNKKVRWTALNIIAVSLRNDREYCTFNYNLNKRPYIYYSLSDSDKINLQGHIKDLLIHFPLSSQRAIYILDYLNNSDFKETISSVLSSCAEVNAENIEKLKAKDRIKYHKKLTATSNLILLYMRLFPDKKYITALNTAISRFKLSPGWGIDYQNLLWTLWSVDLYKNDSIIRENLYSPLVIKQILNPPDYKKIKFSIMKEYFYYIASENNEKYSVPNFQYIFPGNISISLMNFIIEKIKNMQNKETKQLYLYKLTYSMCLSFEHADKNKIPLLLKFIALSNEVLPGSAEYRRLLEAALSSSIYTENQAVRDIVFALDNVKIMGNNPNIYPFATVKTNTLSTKTVDYLIKKINKQNVFLQKIWINNVLPSIVNSLKKLQIDKKLKPAEAALRMKQLFVLVAKNPATADVFIKLLKDAMTQLCVNEEVIRNIISKKINVEKLKTHKLKSVSVFDYNTIQFILKKIKNSSNPELYWTVFRNSIFKSLSALIKKEKNNLKFLPLIAKVADLQKIVEFRNKDKLMLFRISLAGAGVNSISIRNNVFKDDIISLVASSKYKFKSSFMDYDMVSWILRRVADLPEQKYNKWWKALGESVFASMEKTPDKRYIPVLCRYCNAVFNSSDSPVPVKALIKTVFSKSYINDKKICDTVFKIDFMDKFKNEIKLFLNTKIMTKDSLTHLNSTINSIDVTENKLFWLDVLKIK
jgi:hypothetical protein